MSANTKEIPFRAALQLHIFKMISVCPVGPGNLYGPSIELSASPQLFTDFGVHLSWLH